MARPFVLVVLAATVLAALGTSAQAHVKTDSGKWLFTGSTYRSNSEPPRRAERSDPINVVWRGPSGAFASIAGAVSHIEADWRDRYVPGRYPRGARMRPRTNRPCTDAQWVFLRRGSAANDGRAVTSTRYMSTNGLCLNQYHTRMWSSDVHASFFGEEHRNEWVLTPIHHERVALRCGFVGTTGICRPRHRIDLSFDQARSVFVHAIKRSHCYDRKWAVHPESAGFPYAPGDGIGPYSGIISRISFRHRSDGCSGA